MKNDSDTVMANTRRNRLRLILGCFVIAITLFCVLFLCSIIYTIMSRSAVEPLSTLWAVFLIVCPITGVLAWLGYRLVRPRPKPAGLPSPDRCPVTPQTIHFETSQTRPWVRLIARALDVQLTAFTAVLILYAGTTLYPPLMKSLWTHYLVYVVLLVTIPTLAEASLIAAFGATPGKALLNVRVLGIDHQKISWWHGLQRTLGVYCIGFGAGLAFPLALIIVVGVFRHRGAEGLIGLIRLGAIYLTTLAAVAVLSLAWAYFQLRRSGTTWWDRGKRTVLHGPVGLSRVVMFALIVLSVHVVTYSMVARTNRLAHVAAQTPVVPPAETLQNAELMAARQDYVSLIRELRKHQTNPISLLWLATKASEGHPPLQFELSRWLARTNIPEALMWLHQAQLGTAQDAALCEDQTARAATSAMMFNYGDVMKLAQQNPGLYLQAARRSLQIEAGRTNRPSALWVCAHGMKVGQGVPPTLIPAEQWESARARVRAKFLAPRKATDPIL